MDATLLQLINDFSLDDYEPIFSRDLSLGKPLRPKAGNLATVVVGMRRSGKSYRLFQEMKELQLSGVDSSRILYFSFEDDRLDPVTPQTGDDVMEAFRLLHPEAFEKGVYLFFDEIQEMSGWDRWLRRIIDTTKATIYITGSSSKLLIEDVATAFRGRSVALELLPFSFAEFVRFHDEGLSQHEGIGLSTIEHAKLRNLLTEYLKRGGFPAVQEQPLPLAFQTLQSYAQRVIAKDVLERHNVAQGRAAAIFGQRLLGATARKVSLRKMENDLRSRGIKTSRAALSEWMGYFQDAYMVATVRDRSRALSENTTAQPKVYAIDPGLAAANAPASVDDVGHRLETAVYLELRRRNPLLRKEGITSYLTSSGYEVDFCVGDVLEEEICCLYQVAAHLSEEKTWERELRSLNEAMAERNVAESWLISLDDRTEDVEVAGRIVHIRPAWQWLYKKENVK